MTLTAPTTSKRTGSTGPRAGSPRLSTRSMLLVAAAGGAVAAAGPLLVCLAVGVIGWFVTDAGAHGTPTDAMGVGAAGWLMAHGSGVEIAGARIGIVPLGLTAICGWVTWLTGRRVGELVSGHGPDADTLADGARDWTVPGAAAALMGGYFVVAVAAATLSGRAGLSLPAVALWCLLLGVVVAAPAIAIGSGRASIWLTFLPRSLVVAVVTARSILTWFAAVSLLTMVLALALSVGKVANVFSQLHTDPGDSAMIIGGCLLLVPNLAAWAGAYLLGPGFAVGSGTVVSPAVVSLGPLPIFPPFAALPADGPGPGWAIAFVAVPALLAAVAAARVHRRYPTRRWDEGALRACAGGMLAGVGFALVAVLAGGAIGPGRMADVGPFGFDVLVAGITWFGLGALAGGLVMTYWHRRSTADPDDT